MEQLTAPTEVLAIEIADLRIQESEPYLSETRKEQIRRRIAYISFELSERAKENGTIPQPSTTA